jgi:FkbM family methyltransferase
MIQKITARLLRRKRFKRLCRVNGIDLDYSANVASMLVLEEVFSKRTYSNYFPFYKNAVIVDIGAHFGFFTLFAAKNAGPGARIIAVEPSADNYEILLANIRRNQLKNATALHAAVSDRQGTAILHLGRSENHSIFDFPGKENPRSETIEAVTLKGILDRYELDWIDFLKMDCEGAEYPILFNAEKSTLDRIGTISLEFHDMKNPQFTGLQLVRLLINAGFQIGRFEYGPTSMNRNYGWIVGWRPMIE